MRSLTRTRTSEIDREVFEVGPFLREFVVDQSLFGHSSLSADFEQAIGEFLRIGRMLSHLRDQPSSSLTTTFFGLQHASDLLYAAPDSRVLFGRGRPIERELAAWR